MAEGVDLPAIGRVDKKYMYAALALVVGIVGYAWWNRRASAAADTPTVDPTTGSQDPASGGAYVNPRPVQSTIDQTSDTIDTNVEWTQAVTEKLSLMFYDATFIATTLGKYLARQPLTTDEADLVRTAWAFQGKPPEGPDSFTLSNTGGGTTIPETAQAKGGNPVDWWIDQQNAAYPGLGLTRSKLHMLNPAAPIALGNSFGFISPSNPVNRPGGGTPGEVFTADATIRIR